MTRDYYYEIDARGVLTLDGVVQDDPWFVDLFFRRLAPTASPEYPEYPFVSRCGDEMNYLKPADTPIVFTGFDGDRLFYGHGLNVLFHPDRLSYSEDGVLYHQSPVGGRGRIVPQIAMELSRFIEPWGPLFAFNDAGRGRHSPLTPIHLTHRLRFIRPKADNACVGCGEANPHSLQLTFVNDTETEHVYTYLRPDQRMQGALSTTHGGFVSLLLDEAMGKCLSVRGLRAPTAKLSVNFHKPTLIGDEVEVRAWLERQEGRKNFLRGEIRSTSDPDHILAEAEGLFITIGTKEPA
ncbi:MAG: DUF4505 domain-containing protein [Ignavibacteriae bacterium]|nr:MAG: DUF4505 domain-containing protein [Ignavibacteriota bacterium]